MKHGILYRILALFFLRPMVTWDVIKFEREKMEKDQAETLEYYKKIEADNAIRRDRLWQESQQITRDLEAIQDQRQVAAAWRPYTQERKLNKAQQRSLAEGVSETLMSAIEVLARERMRQLSNRALISAEGTMMQAKPMWCGVGVNMLLEDIREAVKLLERKEIRDAQKTKAAAATVPPDQEKSPPRDVTHLYENPKL